jgi:NADPH-dependent ferric siderophore reductase
VTPIIERLAIRAATAYVKLTRAAPIERRQTDQFPMRVTRVADLGCGMRRLTFAAEPFGSFERSGPDEYFGLLIPRAGTELHLPDPAQVNVRAEVARMPEAERPDLRWYTIRSHRPEAGEIDVDILTHGDSGPGSAWALRAQPGEPAGFRSGGGLYRGDETDGPQLLMADETALPALAAVLEARSAAGLSDADLRIHVEVPDRALVGAYPIPDHATIHSRGHQAPGALVVPAVSGEGNGGLQYAWLCGESGMVTTLRRHLVNHARIDRRSILFTGYWKLGEARG